MLKEKWLLWGILITSVITWILFMIWITQNPETSNCILDTGKGIINCKNG